ncbi:class I SAM-dependent methyltransferase [Syntrophus aciditrophicus]|uniref:Hypothetical cytosolic protein n=1 Tax=Syntrophus aciditrophicus (strain SB) TaxID=56780 RepID=Q2LPU3_SYNAS|nr:class I SAM-dependent methyltransferase [Syntrophus aciditrophicus]ABC76303.1 hypothetical cytosolic protein [Syntrophus aciditrophicus SB]
MPNDKLRISSHYLGDSGKKYFEDGFKKESEPGRLFQSRYFQPYCDRDIDLLDFGCADGFILRSLPARRRIGIEVNPAARQRCEELCLKENTSIELHDTLTCVENEAVDTIISNHCLEHVPNPMENLEHMKRCLRPRGYLVLVVPFDDWRNAQHRVWQPNNKDHHLYTWSPMNLGNMVSEAGFQIVSVSLCSQAWSPKIIWIQRKMGDFFFKIACRVLSIIKNRREVLLVARKPCVQSCHY